MRQVYEITDLYESSGKKFQPLKEKEFLRADDLTPQELAYLTSEESLKALVPYSLVSRCRLFEEKFNRKVTKETLSKLYRKH